MTGESQQLAAILRALCQGRERPSLEDRFADFGAWWSYHVRTHAGWQRPIDRALAAGFDADRVAYAFAAGLQSALRRLLAEDPPETVLSVCISEEGGAHPRAIETTLSEDGAGVYRLTGRKQWSTLGTSADLLLVAATRGALDDGRKDLVMVRVPARASGVTIEPMPATAFAPEIEHARVQFDEVAVTAEAILPGDAYTSYIKPFRTVEDCFVTASVAAYLLRIARGCGWSERFIARLLSVITVLRSVARSDPSDPAIHLLLDAALEEFADLAAPEAGDWPSVPEPVRGRWQRDIGLMQVAARARAARRERARELLRG